MKRSAAYVIVAIVILAVGAYLGVSLGMVSRHRHALQCTGLNVTVTDSSRHSFITARDVAGYISSEYGECTGMSVSEIDLDRIERILRAKNPVMAAEAYISSDGTLNVRVVQRTPALRFKDSEEEFFTDSEGYVFHLQSGDASSVTTVTGRIPVRVDRDFRGELADSSDEAWIRSMVAMTKYLKKTGLWDSVAISVRSDGDIILRPSIGKEVFVFGNPDDFRSKFARIGRYYSAILPAVGDNYYSTVSVKFAGQIVCRK